MNTPELKETSHWYFSLGEYQEFLEKYIDEMNTKYGWKENVTQYCRGWFKDGLKDRAVTRDLDWGVKVPLDSFKEKLSMFGLRLFWVIFQQQKYYRRNKGQSRTYGKSIGRIQRHKICCIYWQR